MANLGSLMFQVGADTSPLKRAEREVERSASAMSSSLLSVGNVVKGIAFAYVANQARMFASQVIDTGMKLQQLTLSFKAISGSTAGAAEEMGFIRQESSRLGQDMMSLADAYKGIAAAAKGTSLEGQGVRDVFASVSEAATVLGLTSEQTGRSLYALSQMISKGKVSSEELRQQLGENLPGAFQIAAQSMNMTTQEFDKMLAEGKIMTEDFLPKFSKLLHERYSGSVADSANSARSASNRLSNAMTEFANTIWTQNEGAYTNFLNWMTSVLNKMNSMISTGPKAAAALRSLNQYELPDPGLFLQIMGSTPEQIRSMKSRAGDLGPNTEAEALAFASKEARWKHDVLSKKVFGSETARSLSGKGAAALAADVYGDAIKRNQKYRDKYTSDLEKHQKLLADIRNTGYMAKEAPEDIEARVRMAEEEFAKSQAKGNKAKKDDSWEYQNRVMEEGRRLVESTFTETEKYNLELDKLNWYLGAAAITQEEYDKAVQATWNDLVKANQMSEGWQGHMKILAEGKSVFQSTRTEAEKYAEELNKLNFLLEYGAITQETYQRAAKELELEFNSSARSMSEFAIQAARNIQNALGDQLYDGLTGKFDDIGKSFGQMIAKMIAQATAAQIGNWLFGDFGTTKQIGGLAGSAIGAVSGWISGGSGLASTLTTPVSAIGGMMAEGGTTRPGEAYIVGEQGAELFYPGRSGTIVPNSAISASAAPPKIDVVINNETGQKIEVDQRDTTFDGQGYHASISLKLLRNNVNGYRDTMKSLLSGR